MTKRYVKTEYDGRSFITAGKVYEVNKWGVYEPAGGRSFSFTDDENEVVNCDFPRSDWVLNGHRWIECDADGTPVADAVNAHLIAAAPDLYDALKLLRGCVSTVLTPFEATNAADAALAKARGETK